MSGGSTWQISHDAAATALLHFAKHAHEQEIVAGVFLSRTAGTVCEAVPLVHTLALAPTMTVGLAVVAEFAKTAGLEMCGFYASTEAVLRSLLPLLGKGGGTLVGAVLDAATGDLKVVVGSGKVDLDEKKLETAVNKAAYLQVFDFDDHLQAPSQVDIFAHIQSH